MAAVEIAFAEAISRVFEKDVDEEGEVYLLLGVR